MMTSTPVTVCTFSTSRVAIWTNRTRAVILRRSETITYYKPKAKYKIVASH